MNQATFMAMKIGVGEFTSKSGAGTKSEIMSISRNNDNDAVLVSISRSRRWQHTYSKSRGNGCFTVSSSGYLSNNTYLISNTIDPEVYR